MEPLPEFSYEIPLIQPASDSSQPVRRRHAITEAQRAALRKHYTSEEPKPTHLQLGKWFEEKYGHAVSQSIVSRSLSSRFEYLDDATRLLGNRKRDKAGQWPSLEMCLLNWYRCVKDQGATVTNKAIAIQAEMLWDVLNEYKDHPKPKFSHGWVDNFNKRHGIKPDIYIKPPKPESNTPEHSRHLVQSRAQVQAESQAQGQSQGQSIEPHHNLDINSHSNIYTQHTHQSSQNTHSLPALSHEQSIDPHLW